MRKHNKENQIPLQLVNNEVNVDIFQKVSVNFIGKGHNRRNIQPICRGINGCLHVCEYFNYPKCKQLSAYKVVSLWLNKIGSYDNWEQAMNDLTLVATNLDVSAFLKNVDQNNRVVQALLSLYTSANCPMNNAQNIFFSFSPAASLYLKSSPASAEELSSVDAAAGAEPPPVDAAAGAEPPPVDVAVAGAEGEAVTPPVDVAAGADDPPVVDAAAGEEEVVADSSEDDSAPEVSEVQGQSESKKIVDGSVIPFNLQVFAGFVKSCFGYNTRTFSEMAVQIENKDAFDIAHKVLSKSCGENSECIRLAYCAVGSDLVWDQLQESVKAPGCEYDNFVEVLQP